MQTNYRADQVDGYQARVTMVVVLTDPALAGRARAAALALGPQDVNPINIYLEQTPELQRRALEEAAKDARARAQLAGKLRPAEGSAICSSCRKAMTAAWATGRLARWRAPLMAAATMADTLPRLRHRPSAPPPAPVARGQVGGQTITITEKDLAALDLPSDASPQTIQASVCMVYTLVK